MRKPKAPLKGRMEIRFLVRIFMMVPVMGSPPQYPLLRGRHREERHQKLKYPAGLIRSVCKIPVIPPGDPEHSHIIAADGQEHPIQLHPRLKSPEAHQMDTQKRNAIPVTKERFPGPT
jgi:hypothetical protein